MKKIILGALVVGLAIAFFALFIRAGRRPQVGPSGPDIPRVLVIAPLTGPGAALGASSRAGMEMALADIRKQGVQLELNFQDSRTDPNIAVSVLAGISFNSNRKIFIGEMSQVTRALVAPAERANLLMLATLVGVPDIGSGSRSFARVNVMSDAIATPLARFAAKREAKMAVLYLNDDYGRANHDIFVRTYKDSGGEIVMSEAFDRDPSIARLLVEKVLRSNASACFVAGYGPVYPEIFKAFKQLAPDVHIYADIGLSNAPVFKSVGSAADGVILAATEIDEYPATTDRARELAGRFSRIVPGERPDYVVAYSYDTVSVLSEALKAVPDGDPVRTREYLISRSFEGYGGKFRIDATSGDSIYDPLPLFQIREGKIVRLTVEK
ncbi:MAG: ABC transporter substrate-binding protein [Opitutaceae bacterium]|jgi:branched-chain amino acid transport system substrate-binding protein